MAALGLRQKDLSTIVPQSNLSAILAGKLGGFLVSVRQCLCPSQQTFHLMRENPMHFNGMSLMFSFEFENA